ncbi:Aste57867_1916 [Aphanomyces stellatus]|uniref:Aste57867_1916 protein n=1 Tax=Aphanomyces stellatus TaxID=120398 RepID=A0A485K6W9_9STRA|nr:hypothetical protein As57867_001914 [Aphanomyces stellatus]VFT79121.1 Aste57867_1916 [Aphanomyces stellatus]
MSPNQRHDTNVASEHPYVETSMCRAESQYPNPVVTKPSFPKMPTTAQAAQWYQDESVLVQAIARSVAGYKGKAYERSRVIPRGMVSYCIDYAEVFSNATDQDCPVDVASSCGVFTRLSDQVVRSRVRQLCQVVVDDDPDMLEMLQSGPYHIELIVEDGAGAHFELDVMLDFCSADGGKEPAGCVWDHHSGNLVASWPGSYLEYDVTWLDREMAARFVPHPASLIPTTEDNVYNDDESEFATICPGGPINCSLGDGLNQLELLVLVAVNLACDERYFPQVVPAALLENAKAVYFKTVFGQEDFAMNLASEYLDLVLYEDQEATHYY